MKLKFSKKWNASTQPRKQRKYRFNAPKHTRAKLLSVHLSKPLREKHKTRNVGVRVGDTVRVLRGTHKGKEGKVERIDTNNFRVYVAKVEHIRGEGGNSPYPLQPSNLMITEVHNEKRRFKTQEPKPVAKKTAAKKE